MLTSNIRIENGGTDVAAGTKHALRWHGIETRDFESHKQMPFLLGYVVTRHTIICVTRFVRLIRVIGFCEYESKVIGGFYEIQASF